MPLTKKGMAKKIKKVILYTLGTATVIVILQLMAIVVVFGLDIRLR